MGLVVESEVDNLRKSVGLLRSARWKSSDACSEMVALGDEWTSKEKRRALDTKNTQKRVERN